MSNNKCTPASLKKHTEVPVPGPAGDSDGYLALSPEPNEPLRMRLRYPFNFTLASVASDGIGAGGVTYRMAPSHLDLVQLDFKPLPEAQAVNAHTTIEVELLTPSEGAAHAFQVIRL